MADLADARLLNLDVCEHERFKLDQVNEALDTIENRTSGFTNDVIMHD